MSSQRIAAEEYPHRCLRVSGGIEELLQSVDPTDKGNRHQVDEIVRTHIGQELVGLPEFVKEEIEHCVDHHQHESSQRVHRQSVFHRRSDAVHVALSIGFADERRHAQGKAHSHEQSQDEDVAHQRRRGKLHGSMVTDH